jgi:hypothetical protein
MPGSGYSSLVCSKIYDPVKENNENVQENAVS